MQRGSADIGPAGRILLNFLSQTFKLAIANVLQQPPIGPQCGSFIKIHWHMMAFPDFLTQLMRQRGTVRQRDAANRYQWNYIGGANSRMDPMLRGKIDRLN